MTKNTGQRRTAASIVDGIRAMFVSEQHLLEQAQEQVNIHRARLAAIDTILNDAEKDVETDGIS